jgi:YfiH family protein
MNVTAAKDHSAIRVPALSALPSVRHAFFTRNATAHETHGQANCAYRTAGETADVTATRGRCTHAVDAATLVTVQQRHTPDVVIVEKPWPREAAPVADALVTRLPRVALGILTADCAPVLLADEKAGVIAAAHAGWRGAFDGVIANTVQTMTTLGANAADIVAVVGPCIGAASYEVGEEFRDRFVRKDESFARYFARPRAKYHFDLPAFVRDRLAAAGAGSVHVQGGDTLADEALFFSYRRATLRAEPDYGRQLAAIALVRA